MTELELLHTILDSWNKPVVFVDTGHIIRYLNVPAKRNYAKWGDVIGKSIFRCHSEQSCQMIHEAFEKLQGGDEEVMFTSNEKHRVYMRAVRDQEGTLLGYYERYDPPPR